MLPNRIRPMTLDDVAGAADVIRRNEWGEREPFFRFAVGHPACSPFVAEADGAIVGSGVATSHGRTGWVGMIFVDAALRGRGLGTDLTAAVVDALRAADCETLLLVATAMGRPIYERLGFLPDGEYVGLTAPGLAGAADTGAAETGMLRPFGLADLDAVLALDRDATGEDRGHLLRAIARDGEGAVAVDPAGGLAGFGLPSGWGGWPTVARDAQAARRLLDHRRRRVEPGRDVRSGILDANREGLATLLSVGWREVWRGARMRLGPPLDWRPGAIWGQFNLGVG